MGNAHWAGRKFLSFPIQTWLKSHLSSTVLMALQAAALKLCLISAIHRGTDFIRTENVFSKPSSPFSYLRFLEKIVKKVKQLLCGHTVKVITLFRVNKGVFMKTPSCVYSASCMNQIVCFQNIIDILRWDGGLVPSEY